MTQSSQLVGYDAKRVSVTLYSEKNAGEASE